MVAREKRVSAEGPRIVSDISMMAFRDSTFHRPRKPACISGRRRSTLAAWILGRREAILALHPPAAVLVYSMEGNRKHASRLEAPDIMATRSCRS